MSDAVKGDPIVDEKAKVMLAQLARLDETIFRNLPFDVLGSLVSEFNRLSGLATQHYGIKLAQKIGGVQGSLHNHIKNGVHTSKPEDFVRLIGALEDGLKTPPNMDGTIERCGF